ncbi:MAG: acyl-CoA dehydrogenase protein [Symbiobacteriaceae bacterium]|jgi:alkylation response protein AidB-like acyl-CoA dehydrogenase|nr:acyl-CoA dehydrogenase protein [Symbiobacteriaceae bacterium]
MTLPSQLKKLRHLSRELAADFGTRAARHDQERSLPLENYALLREAGLYGLAVPETYGGSGHGLGGWTIAGEELAQGCGSTALSFAGHVAATGMIMEDAGVDEEAKRRLARQVIDEGKLIALPDGQAGAPLLASRFPGGFRLYGKVTQATMWEAADCALLLARPDPGSTEEITLLVPTRGQGITVHDVWQALGLRAIRSQTITLDGVIVPDQMIVARHPVGSSAWALGAGTAAALGIGVGIHQLIRRVVAGGAPTADSERRLAQMACELEAARLALRHGALLHSERSPSAHRQFLTARYLTCLAVSNASRSAVSACGTRSLMQQLGLERLVRDAVTAISLTPDEDQLLYQIGKMEVGGMRRPTQGEESRYAAL